MTYEYMITYRYNPRSTRTVDRRSARLVLHTENIDQALEDAHVFLKAKRDEHEIVSVVLQEPGKPED